MKRFIITIIVFAIALYGINLGIDVYLSHRLQQCQEQKFVGWSDITQKQLDADLVIVGSSRAWVQYDPAILDSILGINSYNLGLDGSKLNRQVLKYNVFNHYQNIKPKYIIVNIDCFCASEWTYGYLREQFFPYMLNPYTRKEILKHEPFSWAELYIPLYRYTTYKGILAMLKESKYDDKLYKGYLGQDSEWNGSIFDPDEVIHFVVEKKGWQVFEEFLDERYQEGIQVIFCYAPIYAGVTAKLDNRDEMYAAYQGLADKYNIPIIDFNDSEICNDTTYFYNDTHMNRKGAEWFTTQLAYQLDSLGVIDAK